MKEAERLTAQAGELYKEGKYAEALPLAERALAVREKALGPDHQDVSSALDNLASLYDARGDYARAEPLYARSLAAREKALGPNHPDVAISLTYLGRLYNARGEYGRAEPLLMRALAIEEKARGPEHVNVALVLNDLALLYKARGEYGRAEPLYARALAIAEKTLGPDDTNVAVMLANLASLYRKRGDYGRAEPLYLRALAIKEKALGPDHRMLTSTLNSLALLYKAKGDYARAEPLLVRALAIREKALGPEHLTVAPYLNNLAGLYLLRGDYGRAEPLYLRALAVTEKARGLDNLGVAVSLNNLAIIYTARGDYGRAEPLYLRALAIREKALGPDHPDVAGSLNNLAQLYVAKGDTARFVQLKERGQEVAERNLSRILTAGSDRQKLAYLTTLSGETSATVSMHARSAPSDARALRLALTTILRRKGRALDAMSDQVSSLRRRLDPQDRVLLDRLSSAQSRLSQLVLGGPDETPADGEQPEVALLEAEVERLQDAVSRRSAEFRVQTQPVTIEQVRQALPAGTALVEFFSYKPFDARAKTPAERFGPARYVAYVLRKEGEPLWTDLGETAGIDDDVSRLRIALKDPASKNVKELGRALDERVMRPVRKLLGDTRHVFLSPDGALNLAPFTALVDEQGSYLVEGYSLTYLTSGRDLLRLQLASESRQPPLVVGDPLFGREEAQSGEATSGVAVAQPLRSIDMVTVYFQRLSGTAEEVKAIGGVLPGVRVLTQEQATERALKAASGPRVLHVATHGFFLANQTQEATGGTRGISVSAGKQPQTLTLSENPLLRSGLALAGANVRQGAGGEDGILTALETSGLDLWGTKLVVLSACETGVGEVKNGEGVYGLRRALVLAGSESQVMSLWQVSDEATRDLMVSYYKRLQAGEGRTEALRGVQLEMLRGWGAAPGGQSRGLKLAEKGAKRDYSHPYFWAAFIQSGDWRALGGQAPAAGAGTHYARAGSQRGVSIRWIWARRGSHQRRHSGWRVRGAAPSSGCASARTRRGCALAASAACSTSTSAMSRRARRATARRRPPCRTASSPPGSTRTTPPPALPGR